MQIRKTYQAIKPELLYAETRDLVLKQRTTAAEAKLETYSLPTDSSSFIYRGILTFKIQGAAGKTSKECLRVHIVGSDKHETKVMLDIDEKLFSKKKFTAVQEDLNFVFRAYDVKPN
ncbi:hypothetical protein ACFLX7_00685 [Chloroflexota bacterium]